MDDRSNSLSISCTVLLLGVLLAGGLPLAAQHPNHATGFRHEQTFDVGEIEGVNLFNGNLTLTLPIGPTYPVGPGLSYGLTLTWSGNVWDWEERLDQLNDNTPYLQALPRVRSNAGLGWTLSLGRLIPVSDPANTTSGPIYESSDQALHELEATSLHPGGQDFAADGLRFTRDGTYLRLREATNELEMPNGTVQTFGAYGPTKIADRFGNAVTITYPPASITTVGGEPTPLEWRIRDTHGRRHTVTFAVMAGRAVVSQVKIESFGTQPDAVYSFAYATRSLPRACNDPVICDGLNGEACGDTSNATVALLTSVTLPDGSAYSMPVSSYHAGETASCPNSLRVLNGQLERLELPTGGVLEWDWARWSFPQESTRWGGIADKTDKSPTNPFRFSVALASRRHLSRSGSVLGTWSYVETEEIDPATGRYLEHRTTAFDPLGHKRIHYFSVYVADDDGTTQEPAGWMEEEYGFSLTRKTPDGTSGRFLSSEVYVVEGAQETKLLSIYSAFDYGTDLSLPVKKATNPRLVSERTVYEDDPVTAGLRYSQTDLSGFDGLGHFRTAVTSGNFFGADDRTTFTNYNPGSSVSSIPGDTEPWILGTFTEQRVTEGNQTVRRETCFDPATGFLERTRTLAQITAAGAIPARAASDLVVERLQSSGGGQQSDGFVRRERFFGGDGAALDTANALCSMPLPAAPAYQQNHGYTAGVLATSAWEGTSFLSVDRTIDPGTGLIAESRDTATFKTTYNYDEMGRLVSETPEEGAVTVYSYDVASGNAPARVTIETKDSLTASTALTSQEILFDGFGRAEVERRLMPGGLWAERTTKRNALGLVYQRSEWEAAGDPEPSVSKFELFDPFGRPERITLPDGQQITLSYVGTSQRFVKVPVGTTIGAGGIVSTTVATTAEYYDRFGRLAEVREPIEPGNKPRTLYTYDALGNLTTVQQDFGETPSQTRTFAYDGRGFLTSESHPELGAAVSYSLYDALGNPGRVLRGSWDLRYTYDAAGRLVRVTEPGATCDPATLGCWKEWTYATANHQAGTWSKGKLASMRRHNWLIYPPSRFDADPAFLWVDPWAEESYTYDGLGGRISRVTSVIGTGEPAGSGTANANTRPVFLYDLEYDPLGNVVRRSYPSCTHRFCSSIPPTQRQRTVEQTFSQGLLASVPGYASSVSYHPNGLVDRVRHANGVTWIEDNDPDDMARPARIRTSGASSSEQRELDTGVYAYDAAGNVTRTGADRYAYDLLSRIADARLGQYVEACGGDLTLAGVTETVPRTWETCGTIHGGPDYTVASDVTLRAEGQAVFYNGFSVASGASLAVEAGAAVNDAPATPVDRAQSYSYDRFGNLLSMTTTEVGGGSTTRTFATNSSTNRLSSSLVLYDSSGNVTARQMDGGVWWDFDHDPFNMLRTTMPTSTTGYEHLYGPGDERIGVIDWTGGQNGDPAAWIETYTLRDLDGRALRQYRVEGGNTEGNWSIIRDYVWRGTSLLALETPSGVRHMHPDHLGSPRLITDATGTTLAEHVYFPFGEEATPPSAIEVLKFTGHERDFLGAGTTDDLDYMHARYFSPHLGRFMSVDPIGAAPSLPQSWNRYSYVLGNPIKYVDPRGLFGASFFFLFNGLPEIEEEITVIGEEPSSNPFTGVQGLGSLLLGRSFLNSLSGGGPSGSNERPTSRRSSNNPDCTPVDQFFSDLGRRIEGLGSVSIGFTAGALFGFSGTVTANPDGSVTGFDGFGLTLGGSVRGFSTSVLGHSSGAFSGGLGMRGAFAVPFIPGIPLGVTGSGIIPWEGEGSVGGGIGPVVGASGSVTFGYGGTLRDPVDPSNDPCR